MIGAIIGDIAGSRFEFDNYRAKDFELFTKDCVITDYFSSSCERGGHQYESVLCLSAHKK